MSESTLLNDTDTATASLSQVTPDARLAKRKERAVLAALILGACAVIGLSFLPSHTKHVGNALPEEKNLDNTLLQNLKLLAEMKARENVLLNNASKSPVKDGFHPPKLRNTPHPSSEINAEILARMNAPTSFAMNNGSSGDAASSSSATLTANNANAQFVNQQDEVVTVNAQRIVHPDFTVPAGELIAATLETALNSELPGMVRAITTEDVYSLTSGNLLIPKGTTLTGQFNANVVQGQSRLLVVWNRLRLSRGVIVTLNSPGADTLGRSGLGADSVNRHFMERFGTGALLSVLGAFTANSGVSAKDQYNSEAAYRTAIAGSFQQAASHTLSEDMSIKPTLSINQGTRIHVFVARDLDFHSVGAAASMPSSTAYATSLATPKPKSLWSQLWKS